MATETGENPVSQLLLRHRRQQQQQQSSLSSSSTAGARPLIHSRRWSASSRAGPSAAATPTGAAAARRERAEETEAPFLNGRDDVIRFGSLSRSSSDDDGDSHRSHSPPDDEGHDDGSDGSLSLRSSSLSSATSSLFAQRQAQKRQRTREERRAQRRRVDGYIDAFEGVQETYARLQDHLAAHADETDEEEESDESGGAEGFGSDLEAYLSSTSGDDNDDDSSDSGAEVAAEERPQPLRGGFGGLHRRHGHGHGHGERDQGDGNDGSYSNSTGNGHKEEGDEAVVGGPRRQRFAGALFETHVNRHAAHPCHHTILSLSAPLTIQGPCGVLGFGMGEVAVGGFLLGQKQLVLWSPEERAVLLPMDRRRTAAPGGTRRDATELPAVAPVPLPRALRSVASAVRAARRVARGVDNGAAGQQRPHPEAEDDGDEAEAAPDDVTPDVEEVFGTIDWEWVDRTLTSWRRGCSAKQLRNGSPMLLVIQPHSATRGGTRRYHVGRARHAAAARLGRAAPEDVEPDAYMDLPRFFSRRSEYAVDPALLPSVVPTIAAMDAGAVMAVGSQHTGKSTLCRFLANALYSQHGICYWLDLDLGQPEFGVPGQVGLYRLLRPVFCPHDNAAVEGVAAWFLGTPTVSCPVAAARAVAVLCEAAGAVQQRAPLVINTHGWVLQTGRRVTVEVIQRLRPRHVVHMVRENEEAWAQRASEVMRPANGLNAEVVARRFLVRLHPQEHQPPLLPPQQQQRGLRGKGKGKAEEAAGVSAAPLLTRLPHPASGPTTSAAHVWDGTVHTVRIARSAREDAAQVHRAAAARAAAAGGGEDGKATLVTAKGSAGRQARWRRALASLLAHYHHHQTQQQQQQQISDDEEEQWKGSDAGEAAEAEAATTLLRAPLHTLDAVVLGALDEKQQQQQQQQREEGGASLPPLSVEELAARLERSVVAIRIEYDTGSRPQPPQPQQYGEYLLPRVVPLSALPRGFAVSCYGFVENTEEELIAAARRQSPGELRLRVPLAPVVVSQMMRGGGGGGAVRLSIATDDALRQDTAFMETYP